MIIWLENLNFEMASVVKIGKKKLIPDYKQYLYVLSSYSNAINDFINDNRIKENQAYREAIKLFMDYCLLIGDFNHLNENNIPNTKFVSLIKLFKRCSKLLKSYE